MGEVFGHAAGLTAETIGPDDVTKDPYENIQVRIRGPMMASLSPGSSTHPWIRAI
jgi:hypothetical protein